MCLPYHGIETMFCDSYVSTVVLASIRECQKRILVVKFREESFYRPIFLVEGNGSVRSSEPEKSAAKGGCDHNSQATTFQIG